MQMEEPQAAGGYGTGQCLLERRACKTEGLGLCSQCFGKPLREGAKWGVTSRLLCKDRLKGGKSGGRGDTRGYFAVQTEECPPKGKSNTPVPVNVLLFGYSRGH